MARNELSEFLVNALAGTIGGVSGIVCGAPFDIVKVRQQNATARATPGMVSLLRDIVKAEGVTSLWKGASAAALGQAPNNAVVFGTYGYVLSLVQSRGWFADPAPGAATAARADAGRPSYAQLYVAGCAAGFLQTIPLAPFEHVKVQQQVYAQGTRHLGVAESARAIFAAAGARGLWRGWVATFWRDCPTYGVYFSTYEACKRNLGPAGGSGSDPPPWVLLAGGALAGAASWVLALPADTLKSRIQAAPMGAPAAQLRLAPLARALYAEAGVRGFFRGLGPCLLRSMPVNAVTFYAYEWALLALRGDNDLHQGRAAGRDAGA